MKNKILAVVIAIVCVMLVAVLASCGHTHDYKEIRTPATCTKDGTLVLKCDCGEIKSTETLKATGHHAGTPVKENKVESTCDENGTYDSVTYCTGCKKEMSRELEYFPLLAHEFEDGACILCDMAEPQPSIVIDGDYIYFGEYPQTLKDEKVEITKKTDSRGYYLGSDGAWYAEVEATPYEDGYVFANDKKIEAGETYYFKVEPIKWRVLKTENNQAFIVCDNIITFGAVANNSNAYDESDIRAWLNVDFSEALFYSYDFKAIAGVDVDNTAATTGYAGNSFALTAEQEQEDDAQEDDEKDRLFLLSRADLLNSEYGLDNAASRVKAVSDFARASGARISMEEGYEGLGSWWLRSPYNQNAYQTVSVDVNGEFYAEYVSADFYGIAPAIILNIQ